GRSTRPRLDLRERFAGGELALPADTPDGLGAAADGGQDAQALGPVPPAELRAGDDPGLLVEEVTDVGVRRAPMSAEPGVEALGALRERDLVERFLRRAGDDE